MTSQQTQTEQNKAIARRFFEEIVNAKRLGVADEIFAAAHTYHDPSSPMVGQGPEGQKQLIATYHAAYPDLHHTIEGQIAEGNTVVTRWTARGTQQGELPGIPSTGKSVKVMGIWIHRLDGGQIVESWNVWDTLGMLQQLGVIPAPGSAGS
jgi:steroid delta-isomerase-like uncharacterized protein